MKLWPLILSLNFPAALCYLHFKHISFLSFVYIFFKLSKGIIASLPVFGVNHYGYGLWCDFHFNDKSSEGQGYVNFFIFEGKK